MSTLSAQDCEILRRLATRKAEIAYDAVNLERKVRWLAHDAGESTSPLILAEVCGVLDESLPDSVLQCEGEWARNWERSLRIELYQFEELRDDHVVEPRMNVGWRVQSGDYGVPVEQHYADNGEKIGARNWTPPIVDPQTDLQKLKPRKYSVDREATFQEVEKLDQILGDILPVFVHGSLWWSVGLTQTAANLVGLENLMLWMYDEPEALHHLMKFLHDDQLAMLKWAEREKLLCSNNENDYIGSGSMGYTDNLPVEEYSDGPVKLNDMWGLSESQETVGVGPELFEQFIFPYQLELITHFGKSYYGCCEPIHSRWKVLKRIPNLARVSVSPWADQEYLAEEFGSKIVFSRKPNPTLISTERVEENAVRADLTNTLAITREAGCRTELIMKDVHTLRGEPQRLPRWVQIARETADAMHCCL